MSVKLVLHKACLEQQLLFICVLPVLEFKKVVAEHTPENKEHRQRGVGGEGLDIQGSL